MGLILLLAACSLARAENSPAQRPDSPCCPPRFVEVAASSGIHFDYQAGHSATKYLPETMGPGLALLDVNGDGWLDLYLINSGAVDGGTRPPNRLYLNRRGWKFEPIPDAGGAPGRGYGMGACAGDIDRDGDPDLYLTAFGADQLLRSDGGRFTDITEAAGIRNPLWSTSCTFVDYDRDGWLDLLVANYVDFTLAKHRECRTEFKGLIRYCSVDVYAPVASVLYRNRGDGTFADVSQASGIAEHPGKSLGVVAGDFNQDGRPDLFVANDTVPNFLFTNQGNGTFSEEALLAGCAYNRQGRALAGMGIAAGDIDANGREDLVVTNFSQEPNSLFRSLGAGLFEDDSEPAGLAGPSYWPMGFGTGLLDVEGDGDLDLFVTNGHLDPVVEQLFKIQWLTYRQTPLLLLNDGRGHFEDRSAAAGPYFEQRWVGRGAAFGDLDNDGDYDIVVAHNSGGVALLRNDSASARHTLVELEPGRGGLSPLGAKVELRIGGRSLVQTVRGSYSYLSQSDLRLSFGHGAAQTIDQVKVQWPDGRTVEYGPAPAGRWLVVRENGEQITTRPLAGSSAPEPSSVGSRN